MNASVLVLGVRTPRFKKKHGKLSAEIAMSKMTESEELPEYPSYSIGIMYFSCGKDRNKTIRGIARHLKSKSEKRAAELLDDFLKNRQPGK